ncbi:hypothetical protein EST38_g5665 [Candolleomyces aberdarensis]|uniref:Nephrocystin 3-like N-terminal domain-containing protein n=1 Tax=Candolleomyces aberdarensis TaxID=2316362 RepID=A0A4V1Q3Y2_9AGAR|nr:hypothetical protein EST38_g5665 [Candolleomyces aberdarensis]
MASHFFAGASHVNLDNPMFIAADNVHQNLQPSDLHSQLRPIPDASHTRDRNKSPPNSACFPGTRIKILNKITSWARKTTLPECHVYFLHGYAGSGKSAISQEVSGRLHADGRLVGNFFFFRNAGERSKMSRFATTLASQLASVIPFTPYFITAAVNADPDLLNGTLSLAVQLERLVYKPFQDALWWGWAYFSVKTWHKGPYVIVIDGLDECEDKLAVEEFIDSMLALFKRDPSIPLRFFITSRLEQHVQQRLKADGVHLAHLSTHESREDILFFLKTSFELAAARNLIVQAYVKKHGVWPTKADTNLLADHIDGSFVIASGLSKYILGPTSDNLTPMERLPLTLNMDPGLDGLYSQTLKQSQQFPHFLNIISAIALVEEPLSVSSLAELLELETYEILHVLANLQAIIQIPGTDHVPVTLCHTSLRDFLKTECRSQTLFVSSQFHIRLAYRCFCLKHGSTPSAGQTEQQMVEPSLIILMYALEYGDVHWGRFWEEQPEGFDPDQVRWEGDASQRDLFLAVGFIRSLVGMSKLRPSGAIRDYMTLNWVNHLGQALDRDPSLDCSFLMTPFAYYLQVGVEQDSVVGTEDTIAFSLSASLFDVLSAHVEHSVTSVRSRMWPYLPPSLPGVGQPQTDIPPWKDGDGGQKSVLLTLRGEVRELPLLVLSELPLLSIWELLEVSIKFSSKIVL